MPNLPESITALQAEKILNHLNSIDVNTARMREAVERIEKRLERIQEELHESGTPR